MAKYILLASAILQAINLAMRAAPEAAATPLPRAQASTAIAVPSEKLYVDPRTPIAHSSRIKYARHRKTVDSNV